MAVSRDPIISIRVSQEIHELYGKNPVIAATARSIFRAIVAGEIVIENDGETFSGVEMTHAKDNEINRLLLENEELKTTIDNIQKQMDMLNEGYNQRGIIIQEIGGNLAVLENTNRELENRISYIKLTMANMKAEWFENLANYRKDILQLQAESRERDEKREKEWAKKEREDMLKHLKDPQ